MGPLHRGFGRRRRWPDVSGSSPGMPLEGGRLVLIGRRLAACGRRALFWIDDVRLSSLLLRRASSCAFRREMRSQFGVLSSTFSNTFPRAYEKVSNSNCSNGIDRCQHWAAVVASPFPLGRLYLTEAGANSYSMFSLSEAQRRKAEKALEEVVWRFSSGIGVNVWLNG